MYEGPCEQCPAHGKIAICLNTQCAIHETWFGKEMIRSATEATRMLERVRDTTSVTVQHMSIRSDTIAAVQNMLNMMPYSHLRR